MRAGRVRELLSQRTTIAAWFDAARRRSLHPGVSDAVLASLRGRSALSLSPTLQRRAVRPSAAPALRPAALPPDGLAFVTDGFDLPDGLDSLLADLSQRCDCTILLARDPWSDGLPLRGFAIVEDLESGERRTVYVDAAARRRYVDAVRERERGTIARFESAGWRVGALHENGGRALLHAFGPPAPTRDGRASAPLVVALAIAAGVLAVAVWVLRSRRRATHAYSNLIFLHAVAAPPKYRTIAGRPRAIGVLASHGLRRPAPRFRSRCATASCCASIPPARWHPPISRRRATRGGPSGGPRVHREYAPGTCIGIVAFSGGASRSHRWRPTARNSSPARRPSAAQRRDRHRRRACARDPHVAAERASRDRPDHRRREQSRRRSARAGTDARRARIRLFTIGIGTQSGGIIPAPASRPPSTRTRSDRTRKRPVGRARGSVGALREALRASAR